MFHLIPSTGYAIASIDCTTAASPLLSGLVALVWLVAGLMAVVALREQRAQADTHREQPGQDDAGYRQAA